MLILAACSSLLGIEKRELDDASLPEGGYEGCRAGVSCSGCILASHREACEQTEPPSPCDELELDTCERCACDGGCEFARVDCQATSGCPAVWACINQTRCELDETATNSCFLEENCGPIIAERGGAGGEALRQATAVRACAAGAACFICLPPEPEPPPECSPAAGCQRCDGCFQTCLCSGDTYATCQGFCEVTTDECSPESGCEGCTTCFDLCSCNGGSFEACTDSCRPTCDPEADCVECDGCRAECQCRGGTEAECETECSPEPEPDPACIKKTEEHAGDCRSCSHCLAQCTCAGIRFNECRERCDYPSCPTNGCDCGSEYQRCSCDPDQAESCVEVHLECNLLECSPCACESCPDEYDSCEENPDCMDLLQCMKETGCRGPEDCARSCSRSDGVLLPFPVETAGSAVELFEALNACLAAHDCPTCGG